MIEIKTINNLLKQFESLPKYKYEPTFLDICHYSGRRFEEICSRILMFYFQPNNEHGLNTLFIDSLFEAIGYNNEYNDKNITINTEEYAEGKRLDILLLNKDWVIGIENKTGANVYNPLDKYKKRIDSYKKENSFKIVLTLYDINSKEELRNINKNGFKILLYTDFLKLIKNKIGEYISGSKMKYIIFLYDFIETLENMKGENIMSKELDVFFSENKSRLDELVEYYQEYKEKIYQKQIKRISEIKDIISKETNNDNWDTYQSWDLLFQKEKYKIGIESWFIEDDNDPLAFFEIVLTSWNQWSWDLFGSQLKKQYPKAKFIIEEKRPWLYVYPKISGHNEDEIIKRLKECYECINKLKE